MPGIGVECVIAAQRLQPRKKNNNKSVDGRHKPGHDERRGPWVVNEIIDNLSLRQTGCESIA
jgi:hypothetical protein